jgi:anaerobic magnesium-protoporphyrin IX monomethyl ester cyclase
MRKKRILFINPHLALMAKQNIDYSDYFPGGILSLATVMHEKKYDVKIIDANNIYVNLFRSNTFNEDEFLKSICDQFKDFIPDYVGIGCMFSGSFKGLILIAKELKKITNSVPIIIGGIHPTIYPEDILVRYSFIDYVLTGEAESTFPDLLKSLEEKDYDVMQKLDGIAFRGSNNTHVNVKHDFIPEVDDIPFTNYNLINVNDYKMDTSNWYSPKEGLEVGIPFPIISSRSCPQKCNFCSMWQTHGKTLRSRSPKNVVDEMEKLYDNYGVRYFQFMDDNLTFEKSRTIEMCEEILKRKLDIQFDTPNGVALNKLDREIIDALVKAGLIRISIAIESGSHYIRSRVIKKGLPNKTIYENTNILAEYNELFINAFFIAGFPEETHSTLDETYQMIRELPLDKFFVAFPAPYPGTRLFQFCIDNKLIPGETNGDWVENENLQPKAEMPHFKPFELEINDLIEFRRKCYDYLSDLRKNSNVPYNYPFRFYDNVKNKPKIAESLKRLPKETLSSNKEWYTPASSGN